MRRRTLLAAGPALVAVLAGCTDAKPSAAPGSAGPTAGPASGSPAAPRGGAPVATWRLTGGFVGPGVDGIRAPRLSIYGDGRAIADANYLGDLPPPELADLVAHLTQDLRAPAVGSRRPGAPAVPDAPDTELTVRSPAGEFTVSAPALQETRDQNAYRAEVYDAHDRLDAVYQRIVKGARHYTNDRVRVVALPVEPGPEMEAVRPWPPAVPVPPDEGRNIRSANLSGDAARGAATLLDPEWRSYRTANGVLLSAAWRYLLPDE